jgi:hypothetical protein
MRSQRLPKPGRVGKLLQASLQVAKITVSLLLAAGFQSGLKDGFRIGFRKPRCLNLATTRFFGPGFPTQPGEYLLAVQILRLRGNVSRVYGGVKNLKFLLFVFKKP